MGIVQDLMAEFNTIAAARTQWETYWRRVSAWVLPQTDQFNSLLDKGGTAAIDAVTGTPVAAERSKHVYDMTSLWGIDRLTSGLVSLKTPESDYWHDLNVDDDFGYLPTQAEKVALESVRNYQFKVRANPASGFWPSHKAAIKSMCAFGDGWQFIKEEQGKRVPFSYQFMSLTETYPAVGPDGRPNRMFRPFSWTAAQAYKEFGDKVGRKVKDLANDPAKRQSRVRIMHAVLPRDDVNQTRLGVRGAQFASFYFLPDDEHLIGEGGFYEFPFTRYAWSNQGQRPYSEGPVAYALAEIQSLNAMGRDELIASQQHLRPPMATYGKNFMRLNFNSGANNPGLISGDGRQLFAPLTTGQRPDFAQAVMERRQNGVREALYLNLWQVLIADVQAGPETATEAMLRAQEKGEMLGPVGISLNDGLSQNVDREIGILARKGAFADGSPLAMPESLRDAEVAPGFTSPLDRLRKVSQVIGAQRTIEFATVLEQIKPGITARLDADEILELAQDVYGAPANILLGRDVSKQAGEQRAATQQGMEAAAGLEMAGNAAKAVGEGASAAAVGVEQIQQSPALQRALQQYQQPGRAAA
jgi:hypothetical protein